MIRNEQWEACLFRVAVEEEVCHHVPLAEAGQHTAELQHLTRQQPPHEPDAVYRLRKYRICEIKERIYKCNLELAHVIVAWNGEIDAAQRRVCVAESNHRDIHERSLPNCLMIDARVSHDEQSRLFEVLL